MAEAPQASDYVEALRNVGHLSTGLLEMLRLHYHTASQTATPRQLALALAVGDIHHVTPLSEINREYAVDPVKDLRPVCPNCHAMLHKRVPAYSISEMESLRQRRKKTRYSWGEAHCPVNRRDRSAV